MSPFENITLLVLQGGTDFWRPVPGFDVRKAGLVAWQS